MCPDILEFATLSFRMWQQIRVFLIRKEKVADLKISGYPRTEPKKQLCVMFLSVLLVFSPIKKNYYSVE